MQVQIGAALLTGLLFGAFQLDKNEETYLAYAVNSKFVELGNNLVKRRARTHASMLEISYALHCHVTGGDRMQNEGSHGA